MKVRPLANQIFYGEDFMSENIGKRIDPIASASSILVISVRGERWSSGVRGDRSCGRRGPR
jgi:hypothetical protein